MVDIAICTLPVYSGGLGITYTINDMALSYMTEYRDLGVGLFTCLLGRNERESTF